MDNVEDITQLAGKFKKMSELKNYADKIFMALKVATDKLKVQEEEIAHLKSLLDATVPQHFNVISSPNIPPELLLCEMEIARIKKTVEDRPLSLEETKRFSILVNDLISIKKLHSKNDGDDHSVELDDSVLIGIIKDGNK